MSLDLLREKIDYDRGIELAGRLDWSPRHNWVEDAGGLPKYIEDIALALIRNGSTRERAIPIAIGTCYRWARGGGNVTAKTRAKAAAAIAEWNAKRAKSKAKTLAKRGAKGLAKAA